MKPSGWIIYNGSLKSHKFLDFAEMIQQAASRNHSSTKLFKNNELLTSINHHALSFLKEHHDRLPDYVVFTDKDIYLAKQFELLNIPVYNSATAIAVSDDKLATYQVLAAHKLPIPKTIVAPKVFGNVPEDSIDLQEIVAALGLPLIVKEAFGSFGEQVYLVHSSNELEERIASLQGKAFMFQEFIGTSYGRDLRLQVVGDKVVTAMMRMSDHDFRANITSGGNMTAYKPTEQEKELAVAGTKAIGADFAGVDLLFGPDGPIICEINSNAHIRNIYEATHINCADFMIDYILNDLPTKKGDF